MTTRIKFTWPYLLGSAIAVAGACWVASDYQSWGRMGCGVAIGALAWLAVRLLAIAWLIRRQAEPLWAGRFETDDGISVRYQVSRPGCHFPDSDPSNNNLNNLRWDTHRSNMHDRESHGTVHRGERHPNVKYSKATVARIRELRSHGMTLKDIASETGVTVHYCQQVCSGAIRRLG